MQKRGLSFQPFVITYKHFLLFLRMRYLRSIFEVYIKGSIHVALMALCFYQINSYFWKIPTTFTQRLFVFSMVFLGYNVIRYYPFSTLSLKSRGFFWFLAPLVAATLVFSLFHFISLSFLAQALLVSCFIVCCAYVMPLKSSQKSLRTRFGVKIFIVTLCWTFLTGVYPLLSINLWTPEHYYYILLYLLLVFVAILPFEIRDLESDPPNLGTIPQLLGIQKTRFLGLVLLVIIIGSCVLSYGWNAVISKSLAAMCIAYAALLLKIKSGDSENITLFWAEAVPAIGWVIIYLNL